MTVLSQTTKRFQRPSLFNSFVYFWRCWVFTAVRAFFSTCSQHGATWAESSLVVGPRCLLAHESWFVMGIVTGLKWNKKTTISFFFFFSQKAEFIVCKEPSFILRLSFFFWVVKISVCLFFTEMMVMRVCVPLLSENLKARCVSEFRFFFRQVLEYMSPVLHNSPGRNWVDTHNQSNISAVKCKNIYTKWDRKTCG